MSDTCIFYKYNPILADELTLVCIGPLTNVAMAIRLDPDFGTRLKECFIMGGNHLGKTYNIVNIYTTEPYDFFGL